MKRKARLVTIISLLILTLGLCMAFVSGKKASGYLPVSVDSDNPVMNEKIMFSAWEFDRGVMFNWDFGDGSKVDAGPNIISHAYAKTGCFRVRVISNDGGIGTTMVMITK